MIIINKETRKSGLIKALIALVLGVYMVVTKANAMTLIVQIISGVILLASLVPLLLQGKYPALQQYTKTAIFGILIALLLFLLAGPISGVIRYILGTVICLFGISMIITLFSVRAKLLGGLASLIFPLLLLPLGAMFFSEELIGKDYLGMVAGIAMIIYGISKGLTVLNMFRKEESDPQIDIVDNDVDEQ